MVFLFLLLSGELVYGSESSFIWTWRSGDHWTPQKYVPSWVVTHFCCFSFIQWILSFPFFLGSLFRPKPTIVLEDLAGDYLITIRSWNGHQSRSTSRWPVTHQSRSINKHAACVKVQGCVCTAKINRSLLWYREKRITLHHCHLLPI